MNRNLVAAIAAAGVAAAGSVPASAQDGATKCWSKGTRTVAASPEIRVYYRGSSDNAQQYACLTKTGRKWRLGRSMSGSYGPGVVNVHVTSRFVGFAYALCGVQGCDSVGVRLLDTKTGKLRVGPKLRSDFVDMSDMVVSRKGGIGYRPRFSDGTVEVHVYKKASDSIVDTGPGIASDSLAFGGETLYWLHDGAARSVDTGS
jgi:hypothetical protein